MYEQMKKLIVITFLLISLSTYGQKEFLKDSPGLSLGIAHHNVTYDDNISSFNFSVVMGHGLSIDILSSVYKTELYPSIGASYIPLHKNKDTYVTPLFSMNYSNAEDFSKLMLSFGIMQCIHAQSRFPLSLRGNLSYHTTSYDEDPNISTKSAIIELGYNQAFFAKNDMYPILGFGTSVNLSERKNTGTSNIIYHFVIGLNMNLGN